MNKKKTWTITFVYVYRGIGDNHCHLTSKSPRIRVSINFYSCDFTSNSPIVGKQEYKANASSYMSYITFLVHWRNDFNV